MNKYKLFSIYNAIIVALVLLIPALFHGYIDGLGWVLSAFFAVLFALRSLYYFYKYNKSVDNANGGPRLSNWQIILYFLVGIAVVAILVIHNLK